MCRTKFPPARMRESTGLDKGNLAVYQQCRGIHDRFTGFGMRRRDQSADHGNSVGFGGNAFHRLAIACDERWSLDEIPGRIATNGQLGKQNETGAGGSGAPGKIDDLRSVAGEISDGGIDLAQRDLHPSSVKRWWIGAK